MDATQAAEKTFTSLMGELDGMPILDDLPNWFAGRIRERVPAGDHDALILDPIAAEREADEQELTFHRAKRIEPGHAP
jgi:flavin reductase (DIM6/NTAB) family NADH-FMN oxidoreductase RutF